MGKGPVGINWAHSLVKTLVKSLDYISHPQGLCGKGFMETLKKAGQLLLMRRLKKREKPADAHRGEMEGPFSHLPMNCLSPIKVP